MVNKKGRRLWYDAPNHKGEIGVRFSGKDSEHIGAIAPVYGSGTSIGHGSTWLFAGFNLIGDELSHRMKDTLIEQIDDHIWKLEKVWGEMVGDKSPDKWSKELSFSPVAINDKLDGREVTYHDVWIYDLNLGAVMMRYETAGWSDWFHWSPGTWIGDKVKGYVGTSNDYNTVSNQVRMAWSDMVKKSHG